MAIDFTAITPILHEFIGDKGIPNAAYKKQPGFGAVKKKKIGGKYIDWSLQYRRAPNRSRTGAVALARPNTPGWVDFNVPTRPDYDSASVTTEALAAVEGDEDALLDLLTNTIEGVADNLGHNHELDMFNHRGAAIGVVGSIPTATTIVLSIPSDINRFEEGMEVRMSSANGQSGALAAGSATVTAVDRDTYTITTDGSGWVAQIADADTGFFIFPDGDWSLGRAGFPDWCPDSTSGLGTAFYNVTRSADPSRLAGHRISGANLPLTLAIRQLCAKAGNNGHSFNTGRISVNQMENLVTELDGKVTYVKEMSSPDAEVGWDSVKILAGGSSITMMSSWACPDDHIYLYDKEEFECVHMQKTPVVIEDMDGKVVAREGSAFAFDVRGQSFSNFRFKDPSKCGVVHSIPTGA